MKLAPKATSPIQKPTHVNNATPVVKPVAEKLPMNAQDVIQIGKINKILNLYLFFSIFFLIFFLFFFFQIFFGV